ncbi:sulfite exporter TauE/SafE family protein [Lyngbya aestuarii BL J]|uniref:Probable membrane transporter protein n=1 Tax=Lyngbya aestuarii BL J TaxID=1348334 RepID=U7QHR8_9CYAN|nr:sulfite exporter TauE/SafE family protein [Lyngbya aestuarii]ERT06832.1 sulfite exporter TauE/SafE family protein [Lyngbya aestuarii BL J]
MTISELLTLAGSGILAGILAGFLGIGGGTVLVPMMLALGYEPINAVATSTLSIMITSISGSIQNWRMGYLSLNRVIGIGFPALVTAQIGAYLANLFSDKILLTSFGLLLLLNIYLVEVRKKVTKQKKKQEENQNSSEFSSPPQNSTSLKLIPEILFPITPHPLSLVFEYQQNSKPIQSQQIARIITGSLAGLLAGIFGIGGGVIMVPLQIILLNETIKTAIQTSLGVIVITAFSACLGHAIQGNVIWVTGTILGLGGLLGAQFSTRFLPKLSEKTVSFAFKSLLFILSIYIFWKAFQ